MGLDVINWERGDLKAVRSAAMDDVLRLCANVTSRFEDSRAPMPILVFDVADSGPAPTPASPGTDPGYQRLTGILRMTARIYGEGGLLCKQLPDAANPERPPNPIAPLVPDDLKKYGEALDLVRLLATSRLWTNWDDSQYRPYAFPRSAMLAAIEEAAQAEQKALDEAREPVTALTPSAVLARLGNRVWRPARPQERAWLRDLASVVRSAAFAGTLVVTALTAVVTRLVTEASWRVLAPVLGGMIVAVALVVAVWRSAAPWSWRGTANWWFINTTYLEPAGTVPSGKAAPPGRLRAIRQASRIRDARATLVIRRLIAACYPDAVAQPAGSDAAIQVTREDALRFLLQLRAHTLLMDLRGDHSRHLDLRHWKRTRPSIVFLPDVDREPAYLELLSAFSDVRTRRSEKDPLLIVAASQQLDSLPRPAATGAPADYGRSTADPYDLWASRVQAEQSPSLWSQWPWVLRYPVTAVRLRAESGGFSNQPLASRTLTARLWPRVPLSFASVAIAVAIILSIAQPGKPPAPVARYCGSVLLTPRATLQQVDGQCIGVYDPEPGQALAFVPSDGGVTLSGAASKRGAPPATGSDISLADLENLIAGENQTATRGNHVTLVYAGALTGADAQSTDLDAVPAVKELAGVYAWQYATNHDHLATMIKIDIANGGDNLGEQVAMAAQIEVAAGRDPTIAGVIGLSSDTYSSGQTVTDLGDAGLAVVDTTNSSDTLSGHWNYFGLSPTNAEEASILAAPTITMGAVNQTAVVFESEPPGGDPYTDEQASDAYTALRQRFRVIGGRPLQWQVDDSDNGDLEDSQAMGTVCASASPPSVIYLADYAENLSQLAGAINDKPSCFAGSVIVLSGDDMARWQTTPSLQQFPWPSAMTLYYVAQTDPQYVTRDGKDDHTDNGSGLNGQLQSAFTLASLPGYQDPIFADGTIALAFDAARALYQAATANDANGRAATAANLSCFQPIGGGATGTIGFGVQHGLEVFKVPPGQTYGHYYSTLVNSVPPSPVTCRH